MRNTVNDRDEKRLYADKFALAAFVLFKDFMSSPLRARAMVYAKALFYDNPLLTDNTAALSRVLYTDETLQDFFYKLCLGEIKVLGPHSKERGIGNCIDAIIGKGSFEQYKCIIQDELSEFLNDEEVTPEQTARFCLEASLKITKRVII